MNIKPIASFLTLLPQRNKIETNNNIIDYTQEFEVVQKVNGKLSAFSPGFKDAKLQIIKNI